MRNSSKILIALFTFLFVIFLTACQNESDEPSDNADKPSQNDNSSQQTDDDSSNTESTESALDGDDNLNEDENTSISEDSKENNSDTDSNQSDNIDTENNNVNEEEALSDTENASAENTSSLKEEYLNRLNDTKKKADGLEATDTSTYAIKKVEDDRWQMWDNLLNEIYGVLNEQLPSDEMNQLRAEQQNWIKQRDDRALEASYKYKGGTQEHVEYSAVAANITEERCYELVENYMK